jgi:hypothetical protein
MIRRCYYRHHPSYANYGGRGIEVCERWVDFGAFVQDMGDKPSPAHSIDRIDNNGNYEPSNCRWATIRTQSYNKRNNRFIRYQGTLTSVMELSARLGISYSALYGRIQKGWPEERWSEPLHRWTSKIPA